MKLIICVKLGKFSILLSIIYYRACSHCQSQTRINKEGCLRVNQKQPLYPINVPRVRQHTSYPP
uniref:Putative ovule protein n=1 Tax=Solanum chacoense TaxID=4108 RepID=A0A0V0ILQ5_SOLCH